jgi:hypothetical protein
MDHVPFAVHLYCRLLRLYPAAFRRRFAADMATDAADGYEQTRALGRMATARFVRHAYVDVAVSIARQWLADDRVPIATRAVGAAAALWGVTLWMLAREWSRGPAGPRLYLQVAVFFCVFAAAMCLGVWRLTRPGDSPRPVPAPDVRPAPRAEPRPRVDRRLP